MENIEEAARLTALAYKIDQRSFADYDQHKAIRGDIAQSGVEVTVKVLLLQESFKLVNAEDRSYVSRLSAPDQFLQYVQTYRSLAG